MEPTSGSLMAEVIPCHGLHCKVAGARLRLSKNSENPVISAIEFSLVASSQKIEKLNRLGPDDASPSAFAGTLLRFCRENFVQTWHLVLFSPLLLDSRVADAKIDKIFRDQRIQLHDLQNFQSLNRRQDHS